MPFLVRFLVLHAVIGIALAVIFVGALVGFDVSGLGTLVRTHADGPLAVALLTCGLGVTFGSVQMGFAVMLMKDNDDPPRGRRLSPRQSSRPVPSPVKVVADR